LKRRLVEAAADEGLDKPGDNDLVDKEIGMEKRAEKR
jgi:hypothetical protein